MSSSAVTDIPAEIEKKEKEIQANEDEVKNLEEGALKKIDEDIKKNEEELKDLKKDTKKYWKEIPIDVPPSSRSAWRIVFPKKYLFKHDEGNTPILEAKQIRGKKKKGEEPSGSFDVLISNLPQGKYTASYTPAWHNCNEDNATVKLYVKVKDHPVSKSRIINIDKALDGSESNASEGKPKTGLRNEKKRLVERIDGLNGSNILLKGEIKALKDRGELKKTSEQDIQKYREQLGKLKLEQTNARKNLLTVKLRLGTYQHYCQLIARIIEKLELNMAKNSSERKIFNQFLNNILAV